MKTNHTKDEQSELRGIEGIVEQLSQRDYTGKLLIIHEDDMQTILQHLQEQHESELAREKSYINAYTEFVDEMSVETPFDVAFEELNKRLSEIMDKHE